MRRIELGFLRPMCCPCQAGASLPARMHALWWCSGAFKCRGCELSHYSPVLLFSGAGPGTGAGSVILIEFNPVILAPGHYSPCLAGRSGRRDRGGHHHHCLTITPHVLQGVLGAGTGAGIIIGSYFAFYSTTKKYLREHTTLKEGSVAFVAGAAAAVGSSFIKVPIAVCIRSVQVGENGGNCPIAYVMLGAYLASSSYCITL